MDGTFPLACTVKPKEIFQHEKERLEMSHRYIQRFYQLFQR